MFAFFCPVTAEKPSTSSSTSSSVPSRERVLFSILMDCSDPISTLEECTPIVQRTREKLHRFLIGQAFPIFSMVCFHVSEPFVVQGHLTKSQQGEILFRTKGCDFTVSFDNCRDINEQLYKESMNERFPYLWFPDFNNYDPDPKKLSVPVLKKIPQDLQNKKPGKDLMESWMAGLCMLHIQSTYSIIAVMQNPDREEFARSLNNGGPCIERTLIANSKLRKSNIFYAWYPTAKPLCLRKWLRYIGGYTDNSIPTETVEFILTDLHPILQGFYKFKLFKVKTEVRRSQKQSEEYILSYFDPTFFEAESLFVGSDDHTYTAPFFAPSKTYAKLFASTNLAICSPNEKPPRISSYGSSGMAVEYPISLLRGGKNIPDGAYGPLRSPVHEKDLLKKWNDSCRATASRSLVPKKRALEKLYADANATEKEFMDFRLFKLYKEQEHKRAMGTQESEESPHKKRACKQGTEQSS